MYKIQLTRKELKRLYSKKHRRRMTRENEDEVSRFLSDEEIARQEAEEDRLERQKIMAEEDKIIYRLEEEEQKKDKEEKKKEEPLSCFGDDEDYKPGHILEPEDYDSDMDWWHDPLL